MESLREIKIPDELKHENQTGYMNTIERILLIRLSALGDCIAALPVFYALREHFPRAHVAWAIQDNFAPLIQTLSGLDEVIIFPRQRWKRMESRWQQLRELKRLVRHLRIRRFDVTVDVQSNSKSAGLAFASRAPLRIGHGREEAKELSPWFNNTLVSPDPGMEHIFQRNLNLLTPLGIRDIPPRFDIPPNKPARKHIRAWLNQQGIEEKQFILLIPFSAKREKEWSSENFSELARRLAGAGRTVVILHGPGEEDQAREILPPVENQTGRILLNPALDIPELVELIRTAGIAVGGDTGPMQIAGAAGVETIGLFGPTDPRRSHPWGCRKVFSLDTDVSPVLQEILEVSQLSLLK